PRGVRLATGSIHLISTLGDSPPYLSGIRSVSRPPASADANLDSEPNGRLDLLFASRTTTNAARCYGSRRDGSSASARSFGVASVDSPAPAESPTAAPSAPSHGRLLSADFRGFPSWVSLDWHSRWSPL